MAEQGAFEIDHDACDGGSVKSGAFPPVGSNDRPDDGPRLPIAHVITRDVLNDASLLAALRANRHPGFPLLSDDERDASLDAILETHDPGQDVWIFGYGSLLWNPAFHFAERRAGTIGGWHRRYCLWTPLGRGTPQSPGLMLALDRGGSCRGVAFRISAADVRAELTLIWRREMLSGAYVPRWVDVATSAGPARAVTFVINRRHSGYAGRLSEAEVAARVATATGFLGSCADYLDHTIAALHEFGIVDRGLSKLQKRVATLGTGAPCR